MSRKLPRRTFQLIALSGLVPGLIVTYRFSPFLIRKLRPLSPDTPALMTTLAVALTALGVTLVWALIMMPLRARSEMTPIREELAQMRAKGGFVAHVREEQRKLDAMAADPDPKQQARHHGRLAAAGLGISLLAGLIVVVLWRDDKLFVAVGLFAAVSPLVTLYFFVRYLIATASGKSAREPPA